MRRISLLLVSLPMACSGGGDGAPPAAAADPPDAATALDGAAAADTGQVQGDAAPRADASIPADATVHHDAAAAHDSAPACKKEVTVVFSVGTGAGAVGSHSNGCWTVLDADGAANAAYRKCSTSTFVVHNAGASSYAYDDTNPSRPLSQDQSFLSQCASGATGIGFEYMAYRGSWRLLTAPHMKAYFAELYSSDQTVDDYYGLWQTTIGGEAVSPMINIGPNDPAAIESSGLAMCKRVFDHGYFGVYNGAWQQGMVPSDGRAVAIAKALNACTGP